ncbi:phage tail protein [Halomonas sp. MMSF_3323]|uniref:phage tail-collar fiber domain-containing protein n=1 Tax=Halomonas sp. MMSF_3323 TaxID=3046701 RepID=UPI00273F57F1|nr:phage tail protein [Halomonas sp. MMSF_3323]
MPQFYTLLTDTGQAKIANAVALGTQIEITQMAVGDGGGNPVTPDSSATALVNEVRRAPINAVHTDDDNPTWIVIEQVLPPDVGGWTIREVGVFDAAGDLIAIGNLPETYKPVLAEGSSRTQTIRVVMEVSDTAAVTLKVDPSVVLATREYVDEEIDKHAQSRNHPSATESLQGMITRASQSKAEGKTDNEAAMTALRVAQQNATWGGGVNIREYKLPTFQFGSDGVSDEYLILVPWGGRSPSVLMGEIRSSRGGDTASNIPTVEPIVASSAYGVTRWLKRHHDAGSGARFNSVARISVDGSEYLAIKANTSGGVSHNLFSFMGTVIGGDDRILTRVRASDSGVSVIDTVGSSHKTLDESDFSTVQEMIESSRSTDQFSLYDGGRVYYTGEIVRGSDGRFYEFYDRDQDGSVQGVDPANSNNRPQIWMEWHGVRPGSVIEWRSTSIPEGYIENDGAAISRSDYRRIFDVFGVSHGAGDGSTTFNLPDDRGEFKRGWDHGRGVDASRNLFSHQGDEFRSHRHRLPTGQADLSDTSGIWGVNDTYWDQTTSINTSPAPGETAWSSVEGSSNETRPRNNAVIYLTKI